MSYPEGLLTLELAQRAGEFFRAYKELTPTPPPSWPRYFLICHAIELALKAYVGARRALTQHELRAEFGYGFAKLLTEAVSLGLALRPDTVRKLALLDEAHKAYWAHYPRESGDPVWVIEFFELRVVELLEAVSEAVGCEIA
jgi:hypothetical protein